MSYLRADVNLSGVDEMELFLDFERKLEALKKSKYPQACQGSALAGVNIAGLATAQLNNL